MITLNRTNVIITLVACAIGSYIISCNSVKNTKEHIEAYSRSREIIDSLKRREALLIQVIRADSANHAEIIKNLPSFQKRYDSLKKALDYDPELYRQNGQ